MVGAASKKSNTKTPATVKCGGRRPGAGRKPGSRNKSTLAREAGAATLSELAREETSTALAVLKEVATDAGQSGSARVAAATLLDRAYGKPPQLTELAGSVDLGDRSRDVRITLVKPDGTEETETRKDGQGTEE